MAKFQMVYVVTNDVGPGLLKGEVVGVFDAPDVADAVVGGDKRYAITKMPVLCCDNLVPMSKYIEAVKDKN